MDNRWSDSLRRKMEHHGETPPEGLWEAVERGMDSRAEALSRRRRRRMFWSIGSSAAAAVVALLLLIDFGGPTTDRVAEPIVNVVTEPVGEPVGDPVTEPVAEPFADVPRTITGAIADTTPEIIPEMIPEMIPEIIPAAIPEIATVTNPEIAPETNPEVAPEPQPRRERPTEPVFAPGYEQYIARPLPVSSTRSRKSSRKGKWQAGLYASNSTMTGSRSEMSFGRPANSAPMFSDLADSYHYIGINSSSPTAPPRIALAIGSENRTVFNNVKHRLPVTVGVSVGYGLGERWSLTGGVTYTRLASTFKITSGLYSGSYVQVLHYIGIPLDVQFDLWRSAGGFSVYLSAGGQAAKSVGGSVTASGAGSSTPGGSTRDDSVNDPRVRWSVRGSAGVGYDFIPAVGLYFEPGVDYHFDNGSRVVNVWKDRPLNFGLRLGLRLSL